MDSITLSLLLIGITIFLYYMYSSYNYWSKRGIPSAKGTIPLFGNIFPVLILRESRSSLVEKFYKTYSQCSMVGFYNMRTPVLIICEADLIKCVLQTSFGSFHENGVKLDPELDPLSAKNPFFNSGEVWSTGRKRLTYAFSNVRLKILFESIKGVNRKFVDFLEKNLKSTGSYETELKGLFSRYTGEVVANAGLGVEGFCFEDKPHPLSFQVIGRSFLEPNLYNGIVHALIFFLPTLNKIFRMPFIPKNVDRFFREIVRSALETRKKETIRRNDFLQLMMDMEKTEGEKIDEEVLASHALSFFVDGFETSSISLSFVGYQLAVHQNIQEKLREEVLSIIAKNDGMLTFDGVKEMKYMDQVISESQRIYPAAGSLSKVCTEDYELQGSDGLTCSIKAGTEVVVPIYGLQMDPRYWTDPETFDPDRFSDERKSSIEKYAYLPFGEGPRMCVGMRMALLQIKCCVATLLSKYKLELSPKTRLPIKLATNSFLTAAEGGLWVNIKRI